ncbi:MAG TPA: hypothetical protein VGQ11_13180 [Candidatus Acidoferrales bacterium]|nr:hypothetical protein [Candidatus Acidoferrales bacterium]
MALPLAAQTKPQASIRASGGLALHVSATSASADALHDPASHAWEQIAPLRVGLNRTPPMYDTDPPSTLDITYVEVRLVRAGGKLLAQLVWKDATENSATLAQAPAAPPETRVYKEHTQATERFFDAAAIMFPAQPSAAGISPSLQMGDAGDPVTIYYWNAARGAMLMEAQGRGTTRRTGQTFPARGEFRAGQWRVVLELPDLPAGRQLAFAVWNGSQSDRDGRKYFSVWHTLE